MSEKLLAVLLAVVVVVGFVPGVAAAQPSGT
jgi:hypothetical protein